MYWSTGSAPCRDYLDVLTRSGWTPDEWTADAIARNAARAEFMDEFAHTDTDDPGDGEGDDGDGENEDDGQGDLDGEDDFDG